MSGCRFGCLRTCLGDRAVVQRRGVVAAARQRFKGRHLHGRRAGEAKPARRQFLETRGTGEYGPPPWGRRHFLAMAAILGNFLFFVAILLNGVGTLTHSSCGQS